MVRLIIALNIIVYILWHLTGGDHSALMAPHFLISWEALADGRYWTLLGAVFSHVAFWHIFLNMYVLLSFGTVLERLLGARLFLTMYLFCGIISSFVHAAVSNWLLQQPDLPALGASGAISGLILVFALLFPKVKLYILGLIPAPALIGALVFVGLDIWGLVSQAEGGGLPIGHGAHLGGALAGLIFYFVVLRPKRKQFYTAIRA